MGQRVSRSNFGTIDFHTWQASGLPRAKLDDEVEGKGSLTALASVSTVVCNGKACMGMHRRRVLRGCKQERHDC